MSRIKFVAITLLVLLLGACSQPNAPVPGLGSSLPVACNTQALYDKIKEANDSSETAGVIVIIELDERCTYRLAGRALEVVGRIAVSGQGATLDAQGNSRVIINRGYLLLDNLTITGGHATNEGDDGTGGGIFNAGNLRLTNTTVTGNSADSLGGGLLNTTALTLSGTTSISGNTANEFGGGVYNTGDLALEDGSSIRGNTAGEGGGGVFHFSALGGTLSGADYDGLNGDDNIVGNTPDQVLQQ